MSGGLMAYSGIVTKVKAMEGNLLKHTDYQNIANLDSVAEFITYLKNNSGYKHIFANLDEQNTHRGQVEQLLISSMNEDYTRIYRFANQNQRKVLKLIFFRFEVSILKQSLQTVYNHNFKVELSLSEDFVNKHSKLNFQSLSNSRNIGEFISLLKGTEYYTLFSKIHNSNRESLFEYEIQLDIYYFKKIWKLKNSFLTKADLKALTPIYGCQIDLLNMMWIYRSKKYYDIDTGSIYANLIPINYKLTKSQISKMVESNSTDEFIAIMKSTYYHRIYGELFNDKANDLETLYQNIQNKFNHDNIHKYPHSMAPIVSFIFYKEQEIDKLTTALECIRYKLEPSEILSYISE